MRVNLFDDRLVINGGQHEPTWWGKFCDETPILRLSNEREITAILKPWHATFNVEFHGTGWRYLEFESEEDFTVFVLRWS